MALDLSTLQQIGPYAITQCLGANSVVATYAATSQQGELYCLVAMPQPQLAQPAAWDQAQQAAQRLQSGMPPGVLVPEQWGMENNVYFMVYPFLEGTHLGGRVNAEGLPAPFETLDLAIHLLASLKQLHNLGISHRVLNPASIFLQEGNTPQLLHAGWARLLTNVTDGPLNDNLMCILPFLAPEVISQEGADFPSDVYGLAANLFFLLTGQPLFWDDSPRVLADQIISQPPDFSPLDALGNEDLKDLLEEMLEKDPEDRPPNLDALINRFLNIQNTFAPSGDATAKHPRFSEQATIRLTPGMEQEITAAGSNTPIHNQSGSSEFQKPPSARELQTQNKRKNQQEQLHRAQEATELAKLEKQRQLDIERQELIERQKAELRKKREMVKKAIMLVGVLIVILVLAGGVWGLYKYINDEQEAGQTNIVNIKKELEEDTQKIREQKEAENKLAQTNTLLTTMGKLNADYLKKFGIWPNSFDNFKELNAQLPETLEDSWKTPLDLRGEGFIVSAGPDAKFDTKDDLWINSATGELGP